MIKLRSRQSNSLIVIASFFFLICVGSTGSLHVAIAQPLGLTSNGSAQVNGTNSNITSGTVPALNDTRVTNDTQIQNITLSGVPFENTVFLQGRLSSQTSPLPSQESNQVAVAVGPRRDGGIYTGLIAFEATRPVTVVGLNIVPSLNVTSGTLEQFGDFTNSNMGANFDVIANGILGASSSGITPFIGDALEFVGEDDEPFVVSYTLSATPHASQMLTNLGSLAGFVANGTQITDTEGNGDDDEG